MLAACRKSSPALDALGVEVVPDVDVASAAGAARLKQAVGKRPVDLLINNAGILVWGDKPGKIDYDGMLRQFQVNALGAVRVTEMLLDDLSAQGKVAFITSRMGSMGDNTSGGAYGYRMSKAALNAAAVSFARDLATRGVAVAVLHPGMVKTDMIGGEGDIEPDEAAAGLLARIDELTLETSGQFFHQNGQPLPW